MPNIPPPPNGPRIPDASSPDSGPPAGQSKQAQARRKRLGKVPDKPRTFIQTPPGYVLIPEEEPTGPKLSSAERAEKMRRTARERNDAIAAEAALHPSAPALTHEEWAADQRRLIMEKPEREARERAEREAAEERAREEEAEAEAAAASHGSLRDARATDPNVPPRMRRYLRVQDYLDEGAEAILIERRQVALRLRAVEKGRQEALATEYAYPLEHSGTSLEDEEAQFRVRGEPSSVDAVPVKWDVDTVAERGFISMVATTYTISDRAADVMVHAAQGLVAHFPRTLQLVEDGRASYRHALAVIDNGWSVPKESMEEYEDILLPFIDILTPPQFEAKARAVAATYKEDPIGERHAAALERRSLTFTPQEDGMADLTLYMDAVGAKAIQNRMRATARKIFRKEAGRSRTQTEADVASELLLTGTTEFSGTPTIDELNLAEVKPRGVVFREVPEGEASDSDSAVLGAGAIGTGLGAGILATVSIQVPALTLLDKGCEPAYLENYGPISDETAALLAGNAPGFTRILTDPDTGAILSVGTRLYKVPDAMRFWLLFRDRTCRFPGCQMPAKFCDLDHVIDWALGGETKVSNLASLCRKHHMVKHHTGWNYSMEDNGTLTWVSPSGRETPSEPANHIPVKTVGGTVVADVGARHDRDSQLDLSSLHDERDTKTDASGREYLS